MNTTILVAPVSNEELWVVQLTCTEALTLEPDDADEVMAALIGKPITRTELGIWLFESGDPILQNLAAELPRHISFSSYQAKSGSHLLLHEGTVHFVVP